MLLEDAVILSSAPQLVLISFFCSLSARIAEFMSMGDLMSLPHSSERNQGSVILICNCGSDKDNAHIEDVMQKLLCRESRLDLVIFSSADNEEQTIRFVLPTLISTSKQCGRSNIILIKAASRRPRTRMDSLKRVQSRPLEYEEEREYEDNQAEGVKAKLTMLLEGHHAENVFVNTTNPDLLLTLIMEHDGCRQHELPNHNSTTVVPTSSVPFATRASSS
ncbi:hypothetical protein V1523DRAFT_449044 [Lipomyces doorenjongii]